MRKVKWIFFGYMGLICLVIAGIALSFSKTAPRDPQTLYLTYDVNLKSLDPAICNDVIGGDIVGNVYECLYNYEYGVKPYKLYPQLAARMPEVSANGLTYTVELRRGVHFYDPGKGAFPDGQGPEVKAADFVYSWKRIADFKFASPNYSTLFQDKVVGLNEWNTYTEEIAEKGGTADYGRPVEGLTALDDYTLQIKLTRPSPQFRYLMAYLGSAVVSRQAVEHYGDTFNAHPVGTGPYALEDYRPDQRIVFRKNPTYRGRPDVDGLARLPEAQRLPKVERLHYDYYQELIPVWFLFMEGQYDAAAIPKESYNQAINPDTRELRPEMEARGIRLAKSPDPSIFYLGANMKDPVVGNNKPLRQAMSMAFDREKYIRIYLNGRGIPANGPIPPGFRTYDPDLANPYTQYDVAGARQKMVEAERINGGPIPALTLLMGSTDTDTRQLAEFFVSQMKQIGVEIKVEYSTWARFQEMVDARETQLFSLGWTPDYPDEQTFLQLFYGKFAPAGGVNSCAYVNPEYDALYEKARVMVEGPERDALYRKMAAMVREDCPWTCTYYPLLYRLRHDWLAKYDYMDYGTGMMQFRVLDVEKRQKELGKK
ncbi:MAG TPA: ABC transporter substrate-binding protein [Tepidisphaeraceae bacterium]|jgi:ABC-type transport system substrate-binding protein|nr:ABC transporter substrate-binding protein [Tepidisphaeraceae bacterium]